KKRNRSGFLNTDITPEYGRGRRTKVVNQNYVKNYECDTKYYSKKEKTNTLTNMHINVMNNNNNGSLCDVNNKDKIKTNVDSSLINKNNKSNITTRKINNCNNNNKMKNNILDNNEDYETKLACSELKPQRGVYFDKSQKAWIGSWYEEGKQIKRRFKIKYYGWDEARSLAIKARFAFENKTKNLKGKKGPISKNKNDKNEKDAITGM
ncbi:hypothetical protein PFHG_05537, partial [Plasmodium falciparum HB3]